MKNQSARFLRIAILVIISLFIISCGFSFGTTDEPATTETSEPVLQPTNTEIPTEEPTNPPPPTEVPVVPTDVPVVTDEALPTDTVSPLDFFTEEFDGDLSNWEYFFMSGNEDEADFYTEDGKLKFVLEGKQIYAYLLYGPYIYEDTVLTAVAENRGLNNNNVSLICRYDPDEGWYEFNIANNGLYQILAYDVRNSNYNLVADGGSTSIRTGKDVNEYTAICSGKTLVLYINDVETRRIDETTYRLKEGQVGISVSSFDVYPIEVEVESFTIDYP